MLDKEKKLVFYNFFISFFGQIFNFLLLFFTNIIIIRYLGPSLYGNFALIFGIFMMVWYLIESGFAPLIIREINSSKEDIAFIYKKFIDGLSILIFFSFLVLFFISLIFSITLHRKILLVIGSIFCFTLINMLFATYFASLFRGKERFSITTFGGILHKITLFSSIFLISKFDFGIIGVCLSYVLASSFLVSFYILKIRKEFNFQPYFSFKKFYNLEIIKSCISLGGGTLVRRLSWQMEIIFLNLFKTSFEAGIFAAVLRLIQPFQQLSQVISVVFLPFLVRHQKKKIRILIIIAFFILGILFIFSFYELFPIFLKVLGKKYHLPITISIFKILILSIPFVCLIPFLFCSLISYNREILWLNLNIIALVFNTILLFFALKKWHLLGAAISRISTEIFLCILLIYSILKGGKNDNIC